AGNIVRVEADSPIEAAAAPSDRPIEAAAAPAPSAAGAPPPPRPPPGQARPRRARPSPAKSSGAPPPKVAAIIFEPSHDGPPAAAPAPSGPPPQAAAAPEPSVAASTPPGTAVGPPADPLAAPAPSNPQALVRAPKRGFLPAQPKPTQAPAATDHPAFLDDLRMHCGGRGGEVEVMDKVRVRNKGKNALRCSRCSSKITQLSAELGGWPTPEFSALDDESKNNFFGGIRDITSRKDVVAHFHEYMKGFEKHRKRRPGLGELSVKGFDTDRIVRLSFPWDIKDRRVLGKTYRAPIYSAGTAGQKGQLREGVEENSGKSRRKKKGNNDKKGHEKDKGDREARKIRNAKESEREGKKMESQRKREGAKNLMDASAMADKVKHMQTTLQGTASDAAFAGMPQRARETTEEDCEKTSEIFSDVKKIIDGDHNCASRHINKDVTVKSMLADMKRKADAASQLIRRAS
ncbi:unnamed protein product, partial [Prorocentrum cordatum]